MRFPARLAFLLALSISAFSFQADEALRIDSPAAGETVSGMVEISGTAAASGMMRWRVEFAYDPDPTGTWFPIAEGASPVTNGVLAEWDVTRISEGEYTLRIAAYFADGSMRESIVRGIRVRRAYPLATTAEPEAVTPAEVPPQPAHQPPAAFPAPTAAESPASTSAPDSTSLGAAFLAGALMAGMGFGLAALRTRWLLWRRRRMVRRIRKSGG
ncbi:MAG: hypothetical protein JW929_07210 [Anaerolineales bacterium]|nr:hypothetical protein [Anaerolineales bacterium]